MKQQPSTEFTPRTNKSPERASKLVALGATMAIGVAALAGCSSGEVGAKPTSSPTSQTSVESTPTPSTSRSPEKQTPEKHTFSGVIDLNTFTGEVWAASDYKTREDNCNTFFNNNIENRQPLSPYSTGLEVAQGFMDKMLVLQDLASDRSDAKYGEASLNIASCVAADIYYLDGSNPALEKMEEMIKMTRDYGDSNELVQLTYIEPSKVTEYSDGTYPVQSDTLDYWAEFAIKGSNNFDNNTVLRFKWVEPYNDYDLVDIIINQNVIPMPLGPNPPIKVGPGY